MATDSPVIGISCSLDERYSIPQGYIRAIRDAGGFPVVLPLPQTREEAHETLKNCRGLLLSGGVDVDPSYYSESRRFASESICKERDEAEFLLISEAIALHLPVLGICRGLQILNVYFGGSLYQDIPFEVRCLPDGGNPHRQTVPFPEGGHNVRILSRPAGFPPFKEETVRVNSYHHQAIRRAAPVFEIVAKSCGDNIPEAVYAPETDSRPPIMAVQWHPEGIYTVSEEQRSIFKYYIETVRKNRCRR